MFRFLIPPVTFLLLKNYTITSTDAFFFKYFSALTAEDASQRDALVASAIFILVTLAAAIFVDMQVVYKMFCSNYHIGNDMLSSKKDMFVLINWVCSIVVLFTLPYLFSHSASSLSSEECVMAEASGNATDGSSICAEKDNSFGVLLGFTSVSYLVGYFGLLLAMKDQDRRSRQLDHIGAWKQYVPPLFYMVITALLSKQSIYSVQLPVIASSTLFAFYVLNLLWVKSADYGNSKDASSVEGNPAPQCDSSGGHSAPTGLEHYKLYAAPSGSEAKHWMRQLGYDLVCYILPLTALPLVMPSLQLPCSIFCVVVLTLGRTIYEVAAKAIFLQDSPMERPDDALKRQKTYPKGAEFPKGWFRVMNSDQLPKLGVKYIQAMGKDLAVFRGEDGIARCLDAYCIHLGSNMAIGGKVKDNCLQCPFHLWTFDGSGKCTHIPYSPKVPALAKTKAYHVAEWYGIISVWFTHETDEDKSSPEYYPPNLKGIDDGNMVLRGKTELKVNMHLQEFAENSTDFAHFGPLHGVMGFPFTGIDLPMNVVTINHIPDWKEGTGDEAHMAWFLNKADLNIFGKHSPDTGAMAVISFVGPGGLVFFSFDTPLGSLILMQTNTPIEAMRLEVAFRWFADATMPRNLVWYIVGNWIAQYQNDIFIWENKKFLKSPFLVKGDGPMNKQRRWFKQFYPAQPAADAKGSMEW
mmetsp:Transcript_14556/g.27246  ORF Transcript_14556/g.27246 Transcript_14556/m.27246 type:complete len:692 (+) Transcript_14556:84-2159(+)